jgi:hypothetical protein
MGTWPPVFLIVEPLREARTQPTGFFNSLLSEFRQAIDDAKPDFITDLHLHHFGRETGAHMLSILEFELHLPSATLHKMKEKHRSEPLKFLVGRVFAHIKDLGHASRPFLLDYGHLSYR